MLVRDYVAGDAIKQVHWKATAREQKLKVRNRIGDQKQGIVLVMDTKRCSRQMKEYLPVESKMLETLLALGIFMAEHNIGFSAYYGQNGPVEKHVESIRDYDVFYEEIAKVVYREEEDFYGLLTEWLTEAGLLVILYVVTDEQMEDVIRQNNERRKIIVLPVEEELEGRL